MDVRLIRAFIASPGGLDTEREAARAAADEVNISVARALGYRLELLGWEETISGAGRAQAQINAEMDTCDLFIGVMWSKWGSRPSIDGPYSSGFEEEFELSTKRRGLTGSPEMSMFFKNVSSQQQSDAGPELKKVLSFRQKLIDEKAFLFQNFADAEEFAQLVRRFLTAHVIRRYHEDSAMQEEGRQKNRADVSVSASDPANDNKDTEAARLFLISALSLESENVVLSAIDVARLRLVFNALGKSENDDEDVGVHDSNLLFRKGSEFPLSYGEVRSLVGSGLAALDNKNIPIWGRIEEFNRRRPGLFPLFSISGPDSRRIGCINAMRLMKMRMPNNGGQLGHREIVSRWFSTDASSAIRLAGLQYLRSLGMKSDLDLVEVEASSNASEAALAAAETAICILARYDGKEAASRLIDLNSDKIDDAIFDIVSDRFVELSSDRLNIALDHRFSRLQAKAIELLAARNELPIEVIERAAVDGSRIVRLAAAYAYDALAGERTIEDAGRVLVQYSASGVRTGLLFGRANIDPEFDESFVSYRNYRLSKMGDSELTALLTGPQGYKQAAYFELAGRGRMPFLDDIRNDMRNEFREYVQLNWPDGVPSSPNVFAGLAINRSTPDETKRRILTAQALELVASFQQKADLPLIRSVLDKTSASPGREVIRFLRKFGSFEDIIRISRTSRFDWTPSTQRLDLFPFESAASAIIYLSGDRIVEVLGSEIPHPMKTKIIQVMPKSQFKRLPYDAIMSLLFSEIDGVRDSIALRIANTMPKKLGKMFLGRYLDDDLGIYYSVIHWLDLASSLERSAAQNVSNQSMPNP